MKKLIIAIAISLFFASAASAQSKAIGIRGGFMNGAATEVSYQHWFLDPGFLEFDLGVNSNTHGSGFNLTGIYNWQLANPAWTAEGTWSVYAGPGVSLGTYCYSKHQVDKRSVYFSITGQVGIEYTFRFPLNLSFDLRPMLTSGANGMHLWFVPAVSIRYSL